MIPHVPVFTPVNYRTQSEVSSPSAVAVLMVAVLTWGAAWGVQLMFASRLTPGVETEPSAYWFVYATVAAALTAWLFYLCQLLKTRIHMLLARRTTKARLTGSEIAQQYLLRKEIRDRNRPVKGHGGPVPTPWAEYLNSPKQDCR